MYWSPTERYIDQCVHLIYEINNFSEDKNKPTRLGSKIDIIKKNLPVSIPEDLENLKKLTKSGVQIRDVLVHGVLESCNNDEIIVSKVNGKSKEHELQMFTIDLERLNKSAKNLEYINQQWGSISNALFKLSQTY